MLNIQKINFNYKILFITERNIVIDDIDALQLLRKSFYFFSIKETLSAAKFFKKTFFKDLC